MMKQSEMLGSAYRDNAWSQLSSFANSYFKSEVVQENLRIVVDPEDGSNYDCYFRTKKQKESSVILDGIISSYFRYLESTNKQITKDNSEIASAENPVNPGITKMYEAEITSPISDASPIPFYSNLYSPRSLLIGSLFALFGLIMSECWFAHKNAWGKNSTSIVDNASNN